ncbi:MAG: hypothetical protein Q8877_02895 [Sweet potato little leaf phytoplasma]|nr:hypothetical protein [Sweet potato little leaf phytoplasma]
MYLEKQVEDVFFECAKIEKSICSNSLLESEIKHDVDIQESSKVFDNHRDFQCEDKKSRFLEYNFEQSQIIINTHYV